MQPKKLAFLRMLRQGMGMALYLPPKYNATAYRAISKDLFVFNTLL